MVEFCALEVFARNFGADFEHAKATISKMECTAMSHPRMMLRAGFGSAVWAGAQGRAFAEGCGELKSWQNGTILGRIFGHLCTALAHREAVFGRNFGAIFEHAKTTISEERYTAMSHPRMMLRSGFGSAV